MYFSIPVELQNCVPPPTPAHPQPFALTLSLPGAGALAEDGQIYCMPGTARRVLCIDTAAGSARLVGPNIEVNSHFPWSGVVKGSDGALYRSSSTPRSFLPMVTRPA